MTNMPPTALRLPRCLAAIAPALFLCTATAFAAPLSGTKSVGPTGNYASLTATIVDIQAQTVGGVLILELQSTYISSVETFPLVVPALNGASAINTVTIRPASGATALSITSADTTAATVDLNGAQFVTLDGRPGGVGTTKQLTLANTSISGRAVRFINDASENALRFLTLRGVNTSASSGTVVFSTTTGANGNDNNTVDTCDIRDGATTPANALYSLGTTTAGKENSGNTVSNCNIYNFHATTAVDAAGVRLDGGNTDWTISGNSLYQTASRTAVAANVRAIYVNNASGNNFTVTGNFLGGDSPGAAVTTQKWTTTGTAAAYLFQGIQLNVGATSPSSVQGNTIGNIIWTSNSTTTALPGIWSGIYVQAGKVNVGTVSGNTIGSGTGTGSITGNTSGDGGTSFGIGSASGSTVAIANNTIGSITVNGSAATVNASLVGIQVTAGANIITGNTVGSTITANSLNAATSSTASAVGQQVSGILSSSSTSASISGNTVANLNNNYVGTGIFGQIAGIKATSGDNSIIANTVRNLSTTSLNNSSFESAASVGISLSSTSVGQTVSQNLVHSLTSVIRVIGIYYNGNTSGNPGLISRNLVHSLSLSTTTTGTPLYGMMFNEGTFTAQNNMVHVGLTASGTSTAAVSRLYGIRDFGTTDGRQYYHNTVYVGGTHTSIPFGTIAFQSDGGANVRNFRNNIFVNARGNDSTATGSHIAVIYGGNAAGLTANNNLFFVSGTGGVLGVNRNALITTFAAWQDSTGQDSSSAVADPRFVNATGDATNVDLHLQPSNPAEGNGALIPSVTDDFDGQTRSSLTPVDIGADAGTFTLSGDVFAPFISYPLLSNSTTATRTLPGWVSIVDNSGPVSGGANAPRLYYKTSDDADTFTGNTATDNGWKYVTGTDGGSGSYSFTIDYALINGGSVSVGDSIQYFVVAQDAANNLTSRPLGAMASANPPVQNISGKPGAGVNSYNILATLTGGTVTVGPGGNYPNLSGGFGIFATLNIATLTSNLTVNLTGDTTEDGSTLLNAFTAPFTVTLKPASATMRTISGSTASGLIYLNGADRLTIDGSFGGSGRYLTFRNTSASGATLTFINDASNNTVRNCVIEGARTDLLSGVVFFSTGVTTGNDNNTVTGNQVRDRSDAAGVPVNLIYSYGSSDTIANSNNTISNNELINFTSRGVCVLNGSEAWSITGNTIYQTAARTTQLTGIYFNGLGTNTIRSNVVRDLTTSSAAYGIRLSTQTGSTTVAGNRLWNFGNKAASTSGARGIFVQPGAGQSVAVVNNLIALKSSGTTSQNLYGISDQGATGSTILTAYNTVLLTGTGSAGRDTWAFNSPGTPAATVMNNLFLNLRVGGGNHFAANRLPISTGPLTMDNNVYAGTGLTTAANFFDASDGNVNTGIPISFAQWQANVPSDTHSSASNPGGNYTSAMFVDPANGDLHLKPGGNVLVNRKGTPLAGVLTDYDNEPRSATQPYIGADDLEPTNLTFLPNGTLSVLFLGNPGGNYQLQRSTNLLDWDILTTRTAAPDGTLLHVDPTPPPGRAFYRTKVP